MPRRRSFMFVVVDHDRRLFNVYGPISSDQYWVRRIVECQEAGRDVRCFTAREGATKEDIVSEYGAQMKYKFVEKDVLDLDV